MAKTTTVTAVTHLKAKDSTSPKLMRMARSARVAARAVRGIGRALGTLSARAVKFSVVSGSALAGVSTLANKRTREMEMLAKSVGQNVETMEALGVVAGKIGLNYENVIDLAEEMNNKLGEFAGLGEMNSAKEALEIIGLEFKDIKKLKPEEQFEAITEALLAMPDQQKASSAADMLFGGEASKFFGLMHKMGVSLKDVQNQYKANNFLTDDGRKGAVRWAEAMGRLGVQAKTLGSQFAGVMGGALAPFVERLLNWAAANKELIQSKINEWGERFAAWLSGVDWEAVAAKAAAFGSALASVPWDTIGGGLLSVASGFGAIAGAMSGAILGSSNFFDTIEKKANEFQRSGAGRALIEVMDFLGHDVSAARASNSAYDNRQDVAGLPDDMWAMRNDELRSPRAQRTRDGQNNPVFYDAADDAKAHRSFGSTSYGDDGSQRHLQQFVGASVQELKAQSAHFEQVVSSAMSKIQGAIDVNVNVRAEGASVQSVGTVKRTALVGNVGTNVPSGVGSGPR